MARLLAIAFFLLSGAISGLAQPPDQAAKPLLVVAGTSLVEDIVRDLTAERAQILTLIKGSSCPGHNDFKALDMIFMSDADLLILPSFQQELPQVRDMLQAAQNPRLQQVLVQTKGNWMIPRNQIQASETISQALLKARPAWAQEISARLAQRVQRINEAEALCRQTMAPHAGRKVAAAIMQADFVAWTGLDVVLEYGRQEDLKPKDLAVMANRMAGRQLIGVVDNLQSGGEAGLPLARELKVPHAVLSNFPGASADDHDYFRLLEINTNLLAGLADARP